MITIYRVGYRHDSKLGMRIRFNSPIEIQERHLGFCSMARFKPAGLWVFRRDVSDLSDAVVESIEADYLSCVILSGIFLTKRETKIRQWFLTNSCVEETP